MIYYTVNSQLTTGYSTIDISDRTLGTVIITFLSNQLLIIYF